MFIFNDVTNFNFNDRSFNFQFRHENEFKKVLTICCNISVIAPVGCIYFIERDFSDVQIGKKVADNFFEHDLDVFPEEYMPLKNKIGDILREQEIGIIDNVRLASIIPEITFGNCAYNQMTLFNCLFLDEPYIMPPKLH